MKAVRLLLLVTIAACQSPRPAGPDIYEQYEEFKRSDSMARLYPDSAFSFYYQASQNLADSTYRPTVLQKMALLQQAAEDYNGSNESAIQAIEFLSKSNPAYNANISYNYNLLGSNCLELERNDDAFHYYDSAIRFSDSLNIPVYKINKGVAHVKVREYDQAIALYEDVLKGQIADTGVYSRVRSNLAKARWLKNPSYQAFEEFHEARCLRELTNNQLGLNASYSHLADYYMSSRPDSAKYYAKKMYEVATQLGREDDQAEALQKLAALSSGRSFENYFWRYDSLRNRIKLARSKERNQFADTKFNYKKEKENSVRLEKENSERKFRITRQRTIIYTVIGLFTILGILGIAWYRKRKRVQELQTRNAIRESELKTSQRVHDVVANGLYRIMTDLEHKEEVEKERLLDNIENLYEQSRDISYEGPASPSDNFQEQLNSILISFASDTTKVFVVGNQEGVWKNVTMRAKQELLYVLQELMVNMKKHSGAGNVAIRFQRTGGEITVHYKDDGKGLTADHQQGNGMRNTGNRILGIGGRIIFDSNPGKGLSIDISFPIN